MFGTRFNTYDFVLVWSCTHFKVLGVTPKLVMVDMVITIATFCHHMPAKKKREYQQSNFFSFRYFDQSYQKCLNFPAIVSKLPLSRVL